MGRTSWWMLSTFTRKFVAGVPATPFTIQLDVSKYLRLADILVKGVEMRVRKVPGTTLTHPSSGKVIYTPPVGEGHLRDKLANWERFIHNSTDIDPLVRMAVAHYQFEAIHPFLDGNGRTGRILNLLMLIQYELLDSPVLYLSRYIIQNKGPYYDLLLKVTKEQAWVPWILYMLQAT